ncbi:MAG: dTDP-4-dehydrorhamnose 3,5-epimerase family protein [Gammaproteobacteria bacterium]|nr:dTDP-4-dehydrorhamnose 3,5-epimerase family protein [Gammaproteobacteria bacterium]
MKFSPTTIEGAYLVEFTPHSDERGYFTRTWSAKAPADIDIVTDLTECSVSYNEKRGTLRGMHYQVAPHAETKLVSCTGGRVFDAIIDLRPGSASYLRSFVSELTPENGRQLYVPAGCAHGFLTLEDCSYVRYQITDTFTPGAARGVRWNDPQFGIDWPDRPAVIADRDANYEDFDA